MRSEVLIILVATCNFLMSNSVTLAGPTYCSGAFNQEKALVGAFSVIVKSSGTFG